MSYEGQIIKLRWCVRVRVFPHRGKEVVGEKAFQLGDVRAVEIPSAAHGGLGVGWRITSVGQVANLP